MNTRMISAKRLRGFVCAIIIPPFLYHNFL
jgi:hypothetical protein